MDLGIKGKTALVCASSQGLGFATAHRLAEEGASVVLCGRDPSQVEASSRRIAELGGKVFSAVADLTVASQRDQLVRDAEASLGPIDIAVLNTGGPPTGTFETLTLAQWEAAYHSVLEPVVHLAKLVLPAMAARGWGRVLAVASFVARQPADLMGLSNSLRPAVVGLMRTLANEYGPNGVTVNSILPGYILTERMRNVALAQAAAAGLAPDVAFDRIAANVPLRRLGEPAEFASVAAFLVSEPASYVNGAAITVDGGLAGGVY